jgi:hypothetical protein
MAACFIAPAFTISGTMRFITGRFAPPIAPIGIPPGGFIGITGGPGFPGLPGLELLAPAARAGKPARFVAA